MRLRIDANAVLDLVRVAVDVNPIEDGRHVRDRGDKAFMTRVRVRQEVAGEGVAGFASLVCGVWTVEVFRRCAGVDVEFVVA